MAGSQNAAAAPVDLAAYCARIGHSGRLDPTIETLRALHALHPAAIAFENIDVLLGRGVDLAPQAVDAKLIARRRGGYCYEHNGLFKRVLETIGFEVEGLAARVLWNVPADAPLRPRTHMALRVVIDGEDWLADVGFGGCVASAPLRLATGAPQRTPHGDFRIIKAGSEMLVEAQLDGWAALYLMSSEPMLEVDYELGNWFVSAHPSSHFRNQLIVARVDANARYMLAGNRLTVRASGGSIARHALDADQLERALAETFGLPVEPEWRPIIERAAQAD
jgi:N-hydroxyarylamine O-acetyltransferase